MRVEIERKFLLAGEGWRSLVAESRQFRDGLISRDPSGNKTRVRLDPERAWITVKSPRVGLKRAEYEYEIPSSDAEEILRTMCADVLAKTRHCVPHKGHLWVVDVYEGSLAGIILAEVELADEDDAFARPDWIGREISNDPRFRKIEMLRLRRQADRPLTVEQILKRPVEA